MPRMVCTTCGGETIAPRGFPHNGSCPGIERAPAPVRDGICMYCGVSAGAASHFGWWSCNKHPAGMGSHHAFMVRVNRNVTILPPYSEPPVTALVIPREVKVEAKGKRDFDGTIDGAGYKGSMDDPAKPPISLISRTFIWCVARVLGKGAAKYARGNWARGMSFSEVINGVMRHVTAWSSGETYDPETGLNHLAHAACGLMFLLTFQEGPRAAEYARFDDRISEFDPEASEVAA